MSEELPRGVRLRILTACAILPPLLEIVPLNRLVRWSRKLRPREAPVDPRALASYVDWVLGRLPPPWRVTCLRRSIVLYHLLGVTDPELRMVVGVRKSSGEEFEAHAWLAKSGEPFLEREEHTDTYRVIATFPEEG